MADITQLGAAALGRLASSGELTAAEIVDEHIRRIRQINPAINAITDLQVEQARQEAAAADRAYRSGTILGPLHGVPLTIKSSIAAAGCRHECGSPLRRGEVAKTDATLVRRLKSAGAVILGTTNVPEFLMAYETDNAIYGRTSAPFDLKRTSGGSSGGDSAAVASGCSAGSFGSDAGGSVRVPAHFCGLYGLKSTPGEIPRTGHWPAVAGPSTSLASVGPLARTAEDLDLLLRVTAGYDPRDVSSVCRPAPGPPDPAELRSLRIGWFDHAWGTPATRETRTAVRRASRALADAGFDVDKVELRGLEQAPKVWWLLFGIALKTLIEGSVPADYRLHEVSYDAMAEDRTEAGTGYKDLLLGWVQQDQLRYRLLQQMRDYPILLCPVAAIPAFRHRERSWSIEGQTVSYPGAFVYSQVFNLLGVPAASAPAGRSPEGLPIGVQVVGRPLEDRIVTAVTMELESALGPAESGASQV